MQSVPATSTLPDGPFALHFTGAYAPGAIRAIVVQGAAASTAEPLFAPLFALLGWTVTEMSLAKVWPLQFLRLKSRYLPLRGIFWISACETELSMRRQPCVAGGLGLLGIVVCGNAV